MIQDTIENTSTFDPEDILPCEVDWLVKFLYSRKSTQTPIGLLALHLFQPYLFSSPIQFPGPVDPAKVCKELGYENSNLERCCRLWHLGEYFGLPRLQEKALSLLQNRVNVIIDTMENGQVPDPIGEEIWAAVDTCWTDINFAIREYGGCESDVLRLCYTAAEALFSDKGFYQLLDENPEFSVDLAGHMCKQAQPKGHSARRMWIKYRRRQSSKIRGGTDWSEEVIKLNRQAAKRFGSTIAAVTDVLG